MPSCILRRCIVPALLLVLAGVLAAPAQEKKPVEPNRRMLYDYLLKEAGKHFDARRRAVAALKTPEDLRRRQKELRQQFLAALGDLPKKTPLKARVVGTLKGDGFRVERVIYESRPDHHVTALLYLPEGKPPFPGVLVPCGHSVNGKAAEAYQRACILMAKNGLAALCYDPIGQGERAQLLDRQGKPALPGSTTEHTMAGVGALLVGRNTATYRIWDGIRSLDYLAGRPEVDPKRLGCTGNSGGGTLTAYLMALDDRITAAAPSCYITSLERLFTTIGPQDAEQNITGQVAFGMEHADYVTMRAPKPTLICIATRDFFDIGGAWTSFREAKLLYGLMGHGERVDLFEYNDKHGFSRPRREAAMRWMRRWLLRKDDAPSEGDFPVFKDEQLQCTRTGQVLEDFKGRSVFDLNAEREKELAPQRAKFLKDKGRDGLLKEVRRLLALPDEVKPAKLVRSEGDSQYFETEPGIIATTRVQRPKRKPRKPMPVIVYLDGENSNPPQIAFWQGVRLLEAAGCTIVRLPPRGTGFSSPRGAAPRRTNYLGSDVREAFLSLHLNRPLLGQRVYDVLAVVSHLARDKNFAGVHLWADRSMGPVALHAAVLDPRIREVMLERSLASWSAVVRTPLSHNQLCNAIPGVLAFYDLPDLAAALAPRPLTLLSGADPTGQPLTQAELEKIYAACKKAYRDHKAEDRFRLQTSSAASTQPKGRPNVLVVIADDMGWHDIGYHGSEIRTPHLDKLARAGVRLERHYVYPTCSPTRAGLLTGRNPSRFGIHGPIAGRSRDALPADVPTLARVLRGRGYDTALCGKWHLGLRPEVGPRRFGFAHTYGYLHGQLDQLTHRYKNGDRTWHRNDAFVDEKGHATDLIADEAVRFLSAERKGPFFLWVAFSVPHYPLQEEDQWLAPYKDRIKDGSRRLYAASVSHMDDALGRIVAALEKSGQLDNTLILFTSDNGGQRDYRSKTDYGGKHGPYPTLGDNRPLRGWKGELYEGGIRVPAFAYWRGHLQPGVVRETVSYLDWLPTFAHLAGAKTEAGWKLEGRDVWSLLAGKQAKLPAAPLYWNVGRTRSVIDGDWKLMVPQRTGAAVELYDLASDPAEKKNVAKEHPEQVKSLRRTLEEQAKLDPPR